MPMSLLLTLICSYAAIFLLGLFLGLTNQARKTKTKNIKEYQRARAKEAHQTKYDEWGHPSS
jgi:hypothetical protein